VPIRFAWLKLGLFIVIVAKRFAIRQSFGRRLSPPKHTNRSPKKGCVTEHI
jgi:hypothetical protein